MQLWASEWRQVPGYVLKVGLEKGDKTPHELLIKCGAPVQVRPCTFFGLGCRCVLILTAVVPKQLPIQTAMAINTAC